MQIRPLTVSDLDLLRDIDGTVESSHYLHVDQSGEGISRGWRVEERSLRERKIESNTLSEELLFTARQIASGYEEGLALVADYDGNLLAFLLAQPDPSRGVLRLLDLRVDFDYRRQGMGTALGYMLTQHAREKELRAVMTETLTDNHISAQFLAKLGFSLSGIDTCRRSNHDLVKERATLLWYAPLQ